MHGTYHQAVRVRSDKPRLLASRRLNEERAFALGELRRPLDVKVRRLLIRLSRAAERRFTKQIPQERQ